MRTREAMITIAGVPGFGEQPRWLERVAHAANISKRAARAIWRGEIQSPDHRAVVAITREAERLERERARQEAQALASKYLSIAGSLNAKDPDFHQSDVAALINAARILSGQVKP